MELTAQLGQEIIHRLTRYIDVPINLMDPHAKIVASTNPDRINQPHGGAQYVIEKLTPLRFSSEEASRYINTKPGVNLPIFHRGELAGVVGLTGEPDEVFQAAGMTQGSVEIALEQLYIQKQAFYQERQWNYWFHRLTSNENVLVEELEKEALYTLQADVKKTWQVLVFQIKSPYEHSDSIRQKIKKRGAPLFVLPYKENFIVAAIPFEEKPLMLDFNGKVGVGEPGYSVTGIRKSFYQAMQAIEIDHEQSLIVYSASLKMERLLSHIESSTYEDVTLPYANRLHKLEESYSHTLRTFFKNNLKMNQTAADLHIHRNTLIYRLEQIHKKVGLDARNFKDAVILQAILIRP